MGKGGEEESRGAEAVMVGPLPQALASAIPPTSWDGSRLHQIGPDDVIED